jgi:hypothetical protein
LRDFCIMAFSLHLCFPFGLPDSSSAIGCIGRDQVGSSFGLGCTTGFERVRYEAEDALFAWR